MPNLSCTLYTASLYYSLTINPILSILKPLAAHTPHCIAEIIHWFAEELYKGFCSGGGGTGVGGWGLGMGEGSMTPDDGTRPTPLALAILVSITGM